MFFVILLTLFSSSFCFSCRCNTTRHIREMSQLSSNITLLNKRLNVLTRSSVYCYLSLRQISLFAKNIIPSIGPSALQMSNFTRFSIGLHNCTDTHIRVKLGNLDSALNLLRSSPCIDDICYVNNRICRSNQVCQFYNLKPVCFKNPVDCGFSRFLTSNNCQGNQCN